MRLCLALAAVSFFSLTSSAQMVDEDAEQADFATLGAAYTGEVVAGVRGGVKRDAAYLHNIDLTGTLRFDARPGWRGPHIHAHLLGNHGTNDPSAFVGDAQALSNIATDPGWRLFELWVEQVLLNRHVSVLVGLYDLNSEFDATNAGGLFINSSFGIGAEFGGSGQNGPSIFPSTSLAGRIRLMPAPGVYVQAAALDGVPGDPNGNRPIHVDLSAEDGVLLAFEVGLHAGGQAHALDTDPTSRVNFISRRDDPDRDAKLGLGVWHYASRFPRLDPNPDDLRGSSGAYVVGERQISRGYACFARLGAADPRTNRFAGSVTGGCVHADLLPIRFDDTVGLAVSAAINGNPYMEMLRDLGRPQRRAETVVEAVYTVALSSYFALMADVQYIIRPDTNPDLKNALAATFRVSVGF